MVRIISTTGLIFAPDDVQTRRGLQRPDCVAGHVRFELRNVVANYPFEKSRRFGGIQPNSGPGDHSRLSCSEQKKILKRCRGLFYLCAGGAEARRFNRLLIDAGLIQGF